VLKHPKMLVPQCLTACTPKWNTQSGRTTAHADERHNVLRLTVTDRVSDKGNFLCRIIHLIRWSTRRRSAHNLWSCKSPKQYAKPGKKSVSCQRARGVALLAIFSNAYTNCSTLCMSVGFTAAIQIQPYPQIGHKEHPKQICLSRVLRASTIFVTCCQVLKRLLWRLLDLRSIQTES
jgi:hypothetical protein